MNTTLLGALKRIEQLRERSDFYRSWEVALRTHHDAALSVQVMDEPRDAKFRTVRAFLAEGSTRGRPAGVVAKMHPHLFPPLDQLLIGAGDSFGTLADSCRLLSEYYLRDYERMVRVRSRVSIPLVTYFAAVFIVPFPLVWDYGTLAYSAAIIGAVALIFLLGGIPVSLLYSLSENSARISRPRFAWTLAVGLEGGLTFAGAARLAATTSGMSAVGRHLDAAPSRSLKAMTLTQMLELADAWPEMVSHARKADLAGEYISTLRLFAAELESPA
ncbi:MAG: type II secretion system F family protein [Gemmatimonadaceae bacterium]|nr:type II secretion system F family protein [Gemmatimonadaceae bacterium]